MFYDALFGFAGRYIIVTLVHDTEHHIAPFLAAAQASSRSQACKHVKVLRLVDLSSMLCSFPSSHKPLEIDECAHGTDRCQQGCTNTAGSYTCSCNEGYSLSSNGYTCNGMSEVDMMTILKLKLARKGLFL